MSISIKQVDNQLSRVIEHNLLVDLRENSEQSINSEITLFAQAGDMSVVGGLNASTAYGWLLIKLLWVSDAQRQNGIGTQLLDQAELKARQLRCHAAWLDTSNALAKAFYEKRGYEEFGKLENTPGQVAHQHQRWFLKKALD